MFVYRECDLEEVLVYQTTQTPVTSYTPIKAGFPGILKCVPNNIQKSYGLKPIYKTNKCKSLKISTASWFCVHALFFAICDYCLYKIIVPLFLYYYDDYFQWIDYYLFFLLLQNVYVIYLFEIKTTIRLTRYIKFKILIR